MTNESEKNMGPHERHYLRKAGNPLFDDNTTASAPALSTAKNKDHEMLVAYHHELQAVLQETVNLKPNEESDVILGLKERLDRLYETAAAVSDNRPQHQAAIVQLLEVIMAAVRKGAGNDAQAINELEQEAVARQAHFQLLESALVADLLNPDSPIQEKELVPTLLSSEQPDILLALQIFDESQLLLILHEAEQLLEKLSLPDRVAQKAEKNLEIIRNQLSGAFGIRA